MHNEGKEQVELCLEQGINVLENCVLQWKRRSSEEVLEKIRMHQGFEPKQLMGMTNRTGHLA